MFFTVRGICIGQTMYGMLYVSTELIYEVPFMYMCIITQYGSTVYIGMALGGSAL